MKVERITLRQICMPLIDFFETRPSAGAVILVALARMTRVAPVSSSTVSPLSRSASRNFPSCSGGTVPDMIADIVAAEDAAVLTVTSRPPLRWQTWESVSSGWKPQLLHPPI